MTRGDIYSVAGKGDFSSKSRPGLVVQSDLFNPTPPIVTVCPISSTLTADRLYRVEIACTDANGLKRDSEFEIDKVQAIWLSHLGRQIGRASDIILFHVNDALRRWLDI